MVNPIFITHHHFDHIGNLGDVVFSAWNNGRTEPLHIIGPAGTADIVSALLNQVYAGDIKFRLTEAALSETKLVDIREVVKVRDVEPGLVYDNKTWRVYAEYVEHGRNRSPPLLELCHSRMSLAGIYACGLWIPA